MGLEKQGSCELARGLEGCHFCPRQRGGQEMSRMPLKTWDVL